VRLLADLVARPVAVPGVLRAAPDQDAEPAAMTRTRVALCGICYQPMSGSGPLLNSTFEANITVMAAVYLVHLIDEHWDLVERIRATTGDPDGRRRLFGELFRELR
jgi:hypothetical protein